MTVGLKQDSRLLGLLQGVIDFVQSGDDYVTKSFCYVPVNQFNGLAEDCGYYDYEMKSLRAYLAQNDYIRKQGDRYAGIVRIKNRPERVMIFFREKLGVKAPSENGAAKEKSGAKAAQKDGAAKEKSADEA